MAKITIHEFKRVRMYLKMSQFQFAKELGCSQSVLSYIERELLPVSPTMQIALEELKTRFDIEGRIVVTDSLR